MRLGLGLGFGLGLGLGQGLGLAPTRRHTVDEREAFGEERAHRARFLDGFGLEGYG